MVVTLGHISHICGNWKHKQSRTTRRMGQIAAVKYWEIIAHNLSKVGWSWAASQQLNFSGLIVFSEFFDRAGHSKDAMSGQGVRACELCNALCLILAVSFSAVNQGPHYRLALHNAGMVRGTTGTIGSLAKPEPTGSSHPSSGQNKPGSAPETTKQFNGRKVHLAVHTPDCLFVDLLLTERTDPSMPGFLYRDRGLAVLAPDSVCFYVLFAEGTLAC
jgi:hypothetical protein